MTKTDYKFPPGPLHDVDKAGEWFENHPLGPIDPERFYASQIWGTYRAAIAETGNPEDQLIPLVIGPTGIGKTAQLEMVADAPAFVTGYEQVAVLKFNGANATPELFGIPAPDVLDNGRPAVRFVLSEVLEKADNVLLVFDDLQMAATDVKNIALNLMGPRPVLFGVDLSGKIVGRMVIENPSDEFHGAIVTDDAGSTRYHREYVSYEDTLWRESIQARHDRDLTEVFAYLETIYANPAMRTVSVTLCPAVAENVLEAARDGLPAIFALPMPAGEYATLWRNDGSREKPELVDVTDEVLETLCRKAGYEYRVPSPAYVRTVLDRLAEQANERSAAEARGDKLPTMRPVQIIGDPGTGKTAAVMAALEEKLPGVEALLLPVPTLTADTFSFPFLNEDRDGLVQAPWSVFVQDGLKAVVFDEINRSRSEDVLPAMNEILSTQSVNGHRFPGVHALIGLGNPAVSSSGRRNTVRPMPLQTARRFALNVIIYADGDALGCGDHLRNKYRGVEGNAIEAFVTWKETALEEHSSLVNWRQLENMFKAWKLGLNPAGSLEQGEDGESVVPLHDLYDLLAKRPAALIDTILADAAAIAERLKERRDDSIAPANPEEHERVSEAFGKVSNIDILDANRATIGTLLEVLAPSAWKPLTELGESIGAWWVKAVIEFVPDPRKKSTADDKS